MTTKNAKALDILTSVTGPLTLGNVLRSIRQGEALSQTEFAGLLGVSKQYLCDLEHERRSVSPKMAESFAKKLGYSSKQFVRLCLQDLLRRDGFEYEVDLVA